MKRTIPLVVCFVSGIIVIINSFFKIPGLQTIVTDYLQPTVQISTAWSIGLGALNLMRQHGRRISRKSENWVFSTVLIIFFAVFLIAGFVLDGHQQNALYQQWFIAVQNNLNSTMYSILAFYIASSAFRSFRVRSMDASMLLISAFIIMMGAVPIGEVIWSGFPVASEWILNVVNTSSLRAMGLGLTLGGLAQSIRNLVGIERGYLGGE